jgi:hypothetical protein
MSSSMDHVSEHQEGEQSEHTKSHATEKRK